MQTTKEFLDSIFKEHLITHREYIELRDKKTDGKMIRKFYKSVDEALTYQQEGNLYFGVCPRETNKSGKDDNIKYITTLWVDLDIGVGKPFTTKDEAIENLNKFELSPSIIVDSGNGLHAYWLLKKTELKGQNIKGTLKGLARAVKGDEKPINPAWMLRVPNTTNLKDLKNPKEVKILKIDSAIRYDLKDFDKYIVPVSDVKPLAVSFSGEIKDINIDELKISQHLKKLIRTHVPNGERSEKDFSVIWGLVEAGYDTDIIVSVFLKNPIGDKTREQGMGYLLYSIGKVRGEIQGKKKVEGDFVKHKQGDLIYKRVAEKILSEHKIIYSGTMFFEYVNGCYQKIEDEDVNKWILSALGNDFTIRTSDEIIHCLHTICYVKTDDLNNTDKLNLKNGLFSLDTYTLSNHTPDIYSTIQLSVHYNPDATAPRWIKFLDEIFWGNSFKISTLQEFMGLCLTKETLYEKALFCIGEGANGKTVVFYVLEHLLGKMNCSAVPLEKFSNSHYLANFFGKLANISTETNAKSDVYDSIFKAIISGDIIEADIKFKQPFTFHPFCKLIFALNNMPRVEDKTDAYFRRLIILKFERVFKEKDSDKKLKYRLVAQELDGIFIWVLEGLKRLRERGYFEVDEYMSKEIAEYKRENNNVIVFVDEECMRQPEAHKTKDELYHQYQGWCKDNGNKPLSKLKFGKELRKRYPDIEDGILKNKRVWLGVDSDFVSEYDRQFGRSPLE